MLFGKTIYEKNKLSVATSFTLSIHHLPVGDFAVATKNDK